MDEPMKERWLNNQVKDRKISRIIAEFLEALPTATGIFNEERELIHANKAMIEASQNPNYAEAIYLKPGEILGCVNSKKYPPGCGFTESCELCGAFKSMKSARMSGNPDSREFRISTDHPTRKRSYTFRITTAPLFLKDKIFFLITLYDIGKEKRQLELERIFFHDLLNSIHALHGIISLIREDRGIDSQHLGILEATYNVLFDTVKEQQQITQAEYGDLKVHRSEIHSEDLLIEICLPFNEDVHLPVEVRIDPASEHELLNSDPVLLSRVLVNMVKNAVEASGEKDTVTIGTKRMNDYLRFWVHNRAFISRENQLQIFERSFSTKGPGRGSGTFSMKLLGEDYLGGTVNFSSDEKEGTTFWIEVPISPQEK